MKKILFSATLLLSVVLTAQFIDPKISLAKKWQKAETFSGAVGGKKITMHLDYFGFSGWHDKIFSVKGWYQYDQYHKKIPLIGYYNGDLMLYNFGNHQQHTEQNKFTTDFFCYTEPCPSFSHYEEFLEIKQGDGQTQKGKLKIKNKEFDILLKTDFLDVTKRNEWLTLPNGKMYNLYDIIDDYGGNKIVSTFEDQKENRIMLYFERDSNFNKQGTCGASPPETGYRLLTFDKNWKLKKFQVYSTESCLANVELIGIMKTKYSHIKAFYLFYDNALNLLVVNEKNSTFGSRKLRKNYDPYLSFWSKRLFGK